MGRNWAKGIVAITVIALVGTVAGCSVNWFGRSDPREQAINYLPTVEAIFYERQDEFEVIAGFMATRQWVVIDYEGITLRFLQDKDAVHLEETELGFSDEELAAILRFFAGYDTNPLEMWRISSNGSEAEFQLFSADRVQIILVKNPNSRPSPKVAYPYFQTKELTDGWMLILVDRGMSTEELRELEVINGG